MVSFIKQFGIRVGVGVGRVDGIKLAKRKLDKIPNQYTYFSRYDYNWLRLSLTEFSNQLKMNASFQI